MERLHTIRRFLSRPAPWVVIAYVVLFVVVVLGGIVYTREANDRAAHRASVQAQYQQCVRSVPFTLKINKFVRGVKDVGAVLLLNSVQMHAITPPGSPSYRQQEVNIRRLRKALQDQRVVTAFPVATVPSCRAEARARGG